MTDETELKAAARQVLREADELDRMSIPALAALAEALTRPTQTADAVEPVAWRTEYRDVYQGRDSGWHYIFCGFKPNPCRLRKAPDGFDGYVGHRNVAPLYAAPPTLNQPDTDLLRAAKPFAFLGMGEDEDEGVAFTTQEVWETIYQDRVKDWISFEAIDELRQALARIEQEGGA